MSQSSISASTELATTLRSRLLGLEERVVAAVLEDWRTAAIDERLRAVLGYLEKLTLAPKELNVADIKILHLAGLSDRAITEAAYVCYLFSVMDRFGRHL